MLKRDLAGKFFPPEQTEEENKAFSDVLDKADALMHELKAYDELNGNLMQWFYNKYQAQESASE